MASRRESLAPLVSKLLYDVRALDSNLRLLAQQVKVMKKADRILARNLILVNKKLKELKERGSEEAQTKELSEIKEELNNIKEELAKIKDDIKYLKVQLQHTLTGEDVAELKYIVRTVNPLEFVTYKQVSELVEKKLKELGILR